LEISSQTNFTTFTFDQLFWHWKHAFLETFHFFLLFGHFFNIQQISCCFLVLLHKASFFWNDTMEETKCFLRKVPPSESRHSWALKKSYWKYSSSIHFLYTILLFSSKYGSTEAIIIRLFPISFKGNYHNLECTHGWFWEPSLWGLFPSNFSLLGPKV